MDWRNWLITKVAATVCLVIVAVFWYVFLVLFLGLIAAAYVVAGGISFIVESLGGQHET